MALGDVDIGNSYISMLYGDVTRPEYLTFTPNFQLLPEAIAPFEKQMRIFVKGTEMVFLDTTAITRLTTDYYTYTTDAPTAGVRCWGVRFTCDAISESTSDEQGTALVTIYDSDDAAILWDETWMDADEEAKSDTYGDGLTDDQLADASFSTDPTTGTSATVETEWSFGITNFPRAMDINRIGWTRAHTNVNDQSWENVKVEVNVGTPHSPNWITFGDSTVDTVQNVATAHTPGADSLTIGHYPALQTPIVRGTDDVWFDWTTNNTTARDLDNPVPVITVVPTDPADATSDRIVLIRETRQDRGWITPTPGAFALNYGIWWFFEQVRYIIQELCELDEISEFLGLPPVSQERNTYVNHIGQGFVSSGGSARATIDASSLVLLSYAPGVADSPQDQIIVERGNSSDGSSTVWTELTYEASPGTDADDWSIDPSTLLITFGGAATRSDDVRVRRNTRTDQYWFTLLSTAAGHWNSAAIDLIQKQARFMVEESCYLPVFFNENPLSQSLFPRAWNWFTFVGGNAQWAIPGGSWGGDGVVVIYVNDVILVEGTDYVIDGPFIIFTDPPGDGDNVVIGVGGGFGGSGLGGGDDSEQVVLECDDDPETDLPDCPPPQGGGAIDWPGLDLPAGALVTVSIGAASQAALEAGTWEGGSMVDFSQGNAVRSDQFGSSPMRVQITVISAGTVDDGGGGTFNAGATDVFYITKYCTPEDSNTYYAVAAAWHDGDEVWGSDVASAAQGCLVPGGATGTQGIWGLADEDIDSLDTPQRQMWNSLNNITGAVAGGNLGNVPYMNQYLELLEHSDNAASEGWVSAPGFTPEQFDQFVDPDQEFTDFDDPSPP